MRRKYREMEEKMKSELASEVKRVREEARTEADDKVREA